MTRKKPKRAKKFTQLKSLTFQISKKNQSLDRDTLLPCAEELTRFISKSLTLSSSRTTSANKRRCMRPTSQSYRATSSGCPCSKWLSSLPAVPSACGTSKSFSWRKQYSEFILVINYHGQQKLLILTLILTCFICRTFQTPNSGYPEGTSTTFWATARCNGSERRDYTYPMQRCTHLCRPFPN